MLSGPALKAGQTACVPSRKYMYTALLLVPYRALRGAGADARVRADGSQGEVGDLRGGFSSHVAHQPDARLRRVLRGGGVEPKARWDRHRADSAQRARR